MKTGGGSVPSIHMYITGQIEYTPFVSLPWVPPKMATWEMYGAMIASLVAASTVFREGESTTNSQRY